MSSSMITTSALKVRFKVHKFQVLLFQKVARMFLLFVLLFYLSHESTFAANHYFDIKVFLLIPWGLNLP